MRPKPIQLFERIFLTAIVLGVVNVVISWDIAIAEFAGQPGLPTSAPVFLAVSAAVVTAVYLLLWYFIARRASPLGKWILVALVTLNVASMAWQLSSGAFRLDPTSVLGIATLGLMIGAAVLLFHPEAKPWFAGSRNPADPHSVA